MTIHQFPHNVKQFPQKKQDSYPPLSAIQSALGGKMLPDGQLRTYCPIHDGKTPKLDIRDTTKGGEFKRLVICRSCGASAGSEIIAELQRIGLWPRSGDQPIQPPRNYRRNKEPEKTKKEKFEGMIRDMVAAQAEDPQLGFNYILSRGLNAYSLEGGFVHPSAYYSYTNAQGETVKAEYPALCLPILGQWDSVIEPHTISKKDKLDLVGLQRIFLTPDGHKIPMQPNKKVLGQMKGGAFFIGGYENIGKMLVLCEGGETGIALYEHYQEKIGYYNERVVVAAAISANNLSSIPIPKEVTRILIAADKDRPSKTDLQKNRPPAGERFALEAQEYYQRYGIETRIILPDGPIPEGQKSLDWLDVIARGDA